MKVKPVIINNAHISASEDGVIYRENGIAYSQFDNGTGYKCIKVKKKTHYVHRIVLCAFTGKPYSYEMVADHIDHNRGNNMLSNLRWLTWGQNNLTKRKCTQFKLSTNDVKNIRKMFAEGKKRKEIAKLYGISYCYTIQLINNQFRKEAI